jgi:ribose-phosphate pyrophosphokinase
MPFLYESRQHKRNGRESLDAANALQELTDIGVDNIITFDAHDPRVQNAIPYSGFENIMPTYQFIKALLRSTNDLTLDKDHLMVISPDEGAMGRAIYFANVLGINVGMFYKRRDYTQVVNGRNPIVSHEFLGTSVEGKSVIIVDDMISSGDSMIDIAREMKDRGARKVFCAVTFGLFTEGIDHFNKAYEDGIINKVFATNLIYRRPELLQAPWFADVNLCKFVALLIDAINHDASLSSLINPTEKIKKLLKEKENIG